MQPRHRTVERILARIAASAHGVVTRAELAHAGVAPEEIKQRVKRGALIRVHSGVYRVGHAAPSVEARYVAAVKACGDGAVLSGRAAAHLHGLLGAPPVHPEVTAPTERRVAGVRTRRARRGRPHATIVRGIPVTAVADTLVDLAAVLGEDALGRACHEAGVRYRTTPADVEPILERRPNARGAGKLRRIMRGDARVTLSRLERRFLRLLRDAGLPLPETNRPAGSHRVDCRWPDRRLTVELDSYRFHNSRYSWTQDRHREREARARGDDFRRYTSDDAFGNPRPMLRDLRTLLD